MAASSASHSRTEAARRERRAQLLAVARKVLLRDGYAGTSISAIVKEAGVAQGTFYLYFNSKEQVLAHLRAEVLQDYLGAFQRGVAKPARADARLVAGVERCYRAVKRQRDLVRVIRQAQSGEETERVWLEGREALARPFAALLQEGQGDGSFHLDDPQLCAHMALALVDDLFYEALEFNRPASGPVTLRHATRFLLRGLGVPARRVDELVPRRPLPQGRRTAARKART